MAVILPVIMITRLAIWDVESGELVQLLGEDVYFSSYSMVDDSAIDQRDIFFSQDGKRILFKENDSGPGLGCGAKKENS